MSHLVDLSHVILSGRPGYPGLPAPRIEPYISHAASLDSYGGLAQFEITRLFLVGNTGTYLDSPFHRHPEGLDVAGLALDVVAGLRGMRLDAVAGRGGLAIGRDGRSIEPGQRDEAPRRATSARAGSLAWADLAGAAVLVRTGWDARYGTPTYWEPGPYLSAALVDRLVEAGVRLVGVDFWNVDDPSDLCRPAHTRLLGAGIPIVEHLRGLERVPATGFRFHAAPLAVAGAASLPVRAYAEVPSRRTSGAGAAPAQAGRNPAERNVFR